VGILPFTGTPKTITLIGRSTGTASITLLYTDGTREELAVKVED
jgi:carboxylesterase type B